MESALACDTFKHLVTCVRSVFDDASRIAEPCFAARSVNWDLLRALARENRVDVLLRRGLQSRDAQQVPREVSASLDAYEQQNRARNSATDAMLVRILGALADRKIPSLVFKGPLLARYYPDPGMRFYWDVDLLVAREQLAGVHEALLTLGYAVDSMSPREERLFMRSHFAHTYYTATDGPEIDVHWRLFPASFPVPVDDEGLWRRAVPAEINGVGVRTFSPEDLVLYLALHGAKEEWRRLQMIADVAAVLLAGPVIDWDRCMHIADECRARRKLLLALSLAHELLGVRGPPQLARCWEGDSTIGSLTKDVIRRQQRLTGRGTSIFRLSRWRMRTFEHPMDRARYCWRTIGTPRPEHLKIVDLPMLPLAAYVPISLLHDYVAIPLRDWTRRSARKLGGRTL